MAGLHAERLGPVVLTVGDEILLGEMANENQRWMLATLASHGLPAQLAQSLPDDVAAIGRAIAYLRAAGYAPIFLSGGLGGTHDDCSREGIAVGVGRPLARHEECFALLAQKYGDRFNEQRQRMAQLPAGAELIANPIGAPGFVVAGVYAYPGFPTMLQPMLLATLARILAAGPPAPRVTREYVLARAEGDVAKEVEEFARAHPHAQIGIYPSSKHFARELTLRIRCEPTEAATLARFEQLVAELGAAGPSQMPGGV